MNPISDSVLQCLKELRVLRADKRELVEMLEKLRDFNTLNLDDYRKKHGDYANRIPLPELLRNISALIAKHKEGV